jgi:hypothetical protein
LGLAIPPQRVQLLAVMICAPAAKRPIFRRVRGGKGRERRELQTGESVGKQRGHSLAAAQPHQAKLSEVWITSVFEREDLYPRRFLSAVRRRTPVAFFS